jgi:hypothetical protein
MAEGKEHTGAALASRLIDHADAIVNVAAHELEVDLRAAARLLQTMEQQPAASALLPRLVAELKSIAAFSADLDTRHRLQTVLGDFA